MTRALANSITVLTAIILVGVLFQAPISVLADVHVPDAALLVKAWKEILLVFVLLLLGVLAWRLGKLRQLLHDKILWLIAAIGALHVVLLLAFENHYVSEFAGLLIDVRIYAVFVATYILVRVWPAAKKPLLLSVAAGAGVVMMFAFLQATVLPKDVLAHIGYSEETITPYQMVDLNPDYIRVNGTLRGPNPLGALASIVALFALVAGVRWAQKRPRVWWYGAAICVVGICALVALWFSYSRSALLAFVAAAGVVAVVWLAQKVSLKIMAALFAGAVLLLGVAAFAAKDTAFVQNVVLHSNPDGSDHKSDHGHVESLIEGMEAAANQPFGAGLGGVGSASLLSDEPLIIENQYLYIAHESGWLGLALQLWLFGWILWRLWLDRKSGLSLAVLATGVGMAVIGLVLPVWADDTIGLLWWGVAGVAAAIAMSGAPRSSQKQRKSPIAPIARTP